MMDETANAFSACVQNKVMAMTGKLVGQFLIQNKTFQWNNWHFGTVFLLNVYKTAEIEQ